MGTGSSGYSSHRNPASKSGRMASHRAQNMLPIGKSKRVGSVITIPLPPHFDFPIGNMFWARCDAIRPLFDAGFRWEEYPEEPVPIDGTMLHALERLTPFVASERGYRYAMTAVPGITR